MKCIMCRRVTDPDDRASTALLGDEAIHVNCIQNFDNRHGAEISRAAKQNFFDVDFNTHNRRDGMKLSAKDQNTIISMSDSALQTEWTRLYRLQQHTSNQLAAIKAEMMRREVNRTAAQ